MLSFSTNFSYVLAKVLLDELNPIAYRLLQWILKTGRVTLSLVPASKKIKCMACPFQFQVGNLKLYFIIVNNYLAFCVHEDLKSLIEFSPPQQPTTGGGNNA